PGHRPPHRADALQARQGAGRRARRGHRRPPRRGAGLPAQRQRAAVGLLPLRQLRDEALAKLRAAGCEDAEVALSGIVERAGGRTHAEQVAALDGPATVREGSFVDQRAARRAGGEPLQYVLGRWAFRTLELMVDRRVLIPRPETEVV